MDVIFGEHFFNVKFKVEDGDTLEWVLFVFIDRDNLVSGSERRRHINGTKGVYLLIGQSRKDWVFFIYSIFITVLLGKLLALFFSVRLFHEDSSRMAW